MRVSSWFGLSLATLGACADPSSSPLALTDPDLAVLAIAGTQQTIAWTPGASSGAVDLLLIGADGSERTVAAAVPDTGQLTFTVPLLGAGGFHVRIQDAAGGPEAGEGWLLTAAALAGFTWNSATEEEEYSWIDATTGSAMVLGIAGDLRWWSWKGGATFDPTLGRVYAAGNDASEIDKVYTLDAADGSLIATATLSGPRPNGLLVNGAGTLLGFENSPTELRVITIDPATGALSTLATIPGTFGGWSVEHAIDRAADRIYHLEYTGAATDPPELSVFTLDATTGALLGSAPITLGAAAVSQLGGVKLDNLGRLIGLRWDGTVEEMLAVDPATGVATSLGTVGDLQSWQEQTAYDPSTDRLLVFGNDAAEQPTLYAMDVATGALLYDVAVPQLPAATMLVY